MTTHFADYPHSAVIQVASPAENGPKRTIPCTFCGMEGKRLVLEALESLPVSTAISVEHDDELFLGEVVTCHRIPGDAFSLEVKLQQVLSGLQSLMALRARLLGDAVPQPFSLTPVRVLN